MSNLEQPVYGVESEHRRLKAEAAHPSRLLPWLLDTLCTLPSESKDDRRHLLQMAAAAIPQYDIPERQDKLAVFDGDYLSGIPDYIARWDSARIILVASRSLYNNTDHVQKLENILGFKIVGRKIGVGAHSPYQDVIEIAHLLQTHQADCLVSIGSSSYNDASKIASKLANTLPPGFTAQDMESLIDLPKGSATNLRPAACKLILVPTSLSAAEWNGLGSCTNARGKKQHYGCGGGSQNSMLPGAADLVFCDPVLAATAPSDLWLSSGARCIDHCVETVCNRVCSPAAEAEALAGLKDMIAGLVAYKRNDGERGRQDEVVGRGGERVRVEDQLRGISDAQKGSRRAIKDIIVGRNSGGPSHAIGHQLGSVAGVGHGITSCILLGPTLRYTAGKGGMRPFERAREGQGKVLKVFNQVLGWEEETAGDAVTRFFRELGLPTSLAEMCVRDEERIDRIAEATLSDVWGGGEPQITEQAEVRKILDMAR